MHNEGTNVTHKRKVVRAMRRSEKKIRYSSDGEKLTESVSQKILSITIRSD